MSNWIIHVVGETIDDDLAEPIANFVKEIQGLSHKVHQVRMTTDTGEKVINIADTVEKDVDEVADDAAKLDPSIAPEVDTVEAGVKEADTFVDTGIADIEKAEATPVVPTPPAAHPTVEAPVNVVPPEATAPPVSPVSSTPSPTPSTTPPAPTPAS